MNTTVASIRVALLCSALAFAGNALTASDPPSPVPAKATSQPKQNARSNQQQTSQDKRATQEQPAVVELLKTPVIQVEATDKTEKRRDYTNHEWLLVYLTALLATITLGLAIYTAKLYKSTKKIASDAETAASNSVELTRATERAYIKMSHTQPGLTFTDESASVTMEFKNWGRTPGTISKVSLGFKARSPQLFPLPDEPEYEITPEHDIPRAFLVTGESVFTTRQTHIGADAVARILAKKAVLLVIGYVDYSDQFKGRYRSGYARVLVPDRQSQNLVLFTQRGYNYDRPRKPGEGNDLDE